jgi:hypothetical protein
MEREVLVINKLGVHFVVTIDEHGAISVHADNKKILCSIVSEPKQGLLLSYPITLNGQKINGLLLDDNQLRIVQDAQKEVIRLIREKEAERKKQEEMERKKKFGAITDGRVIKVSYTTWLNGHFECDHLPEEIRSILTAIELEDVKPFVTSSKVDGDDFIYEVELTVAQLKDAYRKRLEKLELKKIEADKRKLQREIEFQKKMEEAKNTGEDVVFRSWTEPCNDEDEECDIDHVIEYVTPSGQLKVVRHHTW